MSSRPVPPPFTRSRALAFALVLLLVMSLGVAGAALADNGEPQPSIFGVITDADTGLPIAGAETALLRSQPFGTPGGPTGDGQTVTDGTGAYAFFDREPFDDRHYWVLAGADGYLGAESDPFVFDGTEPIQVNIALEPQVGPPAVTGTVTDAKTGDPIPDATVWIWYETDNGDPEGLPAHEVDEEGHFAMWGIEADRAFRVWAESEGTEYPAVHSEILTYNGTDTLVVDLALTFELQARGIDFAAQFMGDFSAGLTDIAGLTEAHQQAINCLAFYGITVGYADGTYRPYEPVMRSQMALFLARLINYAVANTALEAPAELVDPGFTDIGALSQEAKDAIALLYALGVTQGTTASTFSPYADVTRRDMATFMVRVQNLLEDGSYDTDESFFDDVPDTLARAAHINALAAQGIAVGFGDGTYGPFGSVLRGHMALFLMRHVDENVEAGRLPAYAGPLG